MEDEKIAAAKAFRFLSPLMLVYLFSIFAIIVSLIGFNKSGGWSMIGVIIFAPILFVTIGLDFFIKLIVKENIALLWVIEKLIVLIGSIIYYNRFL